MATKDEALEHGYQLLGRGSPMALTQASEILKQYPNDPRGLRLLGAARRLTGDAPGAAEAERLAVGAAAFDRPLVEAAQALIDNDMPIAERLLKDRLRQDPFDFTAVRMLAEVAARIGRVNDSENLLRRALQLAPSFTEAKYNLAKMLHDQGRSPEALVLLDEIDADGTTAEPHRGLRAAVLGRVGRYDEAIASYRNLLERKPGESKVWMSLAHLLKTVGDQAGSIDAYRRSIAIQPTLGEVWWSLANLKTVRFTEEDAAAMRAALASPDLSDDDQLHLHFALGKFHEDRTEAEESWTHYAAGNSLRLAANPHRADREAALVDRSIKLMDRRFFERRKGQGDPSPDPIFIVGMPRAGSTLVEQILASHSLVEGTMELPDLHLIVRSLSNPEAKPADRYPASLAKLDANALRALGTDYLARTRIHRQEGKPYFIDKMPNNWQHVGLIRLILPNARIIDARRHPLDCGFSNFKQHFARGQNFAYALDDIGRYYRHYVRLMAHYDRVQPGTVHRVIHERLVDNPEDEVRALLAFCGLDYEEQCLRFHENKRAVRTASSEQVRQPLSRAAFDRWRMYEQWLGPLKRALGPALETWDDAARP